MQVFALRSFVAIVNGQAVTVRADEVVDMPDGADWVRAGLVTLVASVEVETATAEPDGERADVRPRHKGKTQ